MLYEIRYGRINKNGNYIDDGVDNNFFKGYSKEEAEIRANELNSGLIRNIRIVESQIKE